MKLKIERKKILYWIPAILWSTVIFIVGSMKVDFNGDNINIVSRVLLFIKAFLYNKHNRIYSIIADNVDKIYHSFEYLVLTVFIYFAVKKTQRATLKSNSVLTALIVLFVGIMDEIHQVFVPTRYCSITDLFADGFGMMSVLVIIYISEMINGRTNEV